MPWAEAKAPKDTENGNFEGKTKEKDEAPKRRSHSVRVDFKIAIENHRIKSIAPRLSENPAKNTEGGKCHKGVATTFWQRF